MTVNQEFEHYKRQVGLNVTNEALTVNVIFYPHHSTIENKLSLPYRWIYPTLTVPII